MLKKICGFLVMLNIMCVGMAFPKCLPDKDTVGPDEADVGEKKWEFMTGDRVVSSPAVGSDGTIYVGSSDGKLYAIHGESEGLADSPWPKFRHDTKNSGNVGWKK